MKSLTKIVLLSTFTTLAFSEVTVCVKKNLEDITKIEVIKLSGGECKGIKNQKEMISNGWKVDDLKIKNNDYLFIFKKDDSSLKIGNKALLKKEIISEIEAKEVEKKVTTQKEIKLDKYKKGKNTYLKKCSSCHGIKGETSITNSTNLNLIKLDDFKTAIKGYKIGSYNLGNSSDMKPYALGISSNDVENIYEYINKINK